jgi:probable rRNA maturation factor
MSVDTLPIAIDLLVEAGDWPEEDQLARLVAQAVEASFAVGKLPALKGSELSVVLPTTNMSAS